MKRLRRKIKALNSNNKHYRSGFEEVVAKLLPKDHEYEPDKISYVQPSNYIPDFKIADDVYIEAKGRLLPDDMRKHVLVRKQHPHLRIIMVFQDPFRKIRSNSKTTYAQWCEKNDIEWCHLEDLPLKI